MNHRRGYATAEEAMRSKAFLTVPGATLDTGCPCGQVHVDVPKPAPSPLGARRDTGPDARTRRMGYERDGWACVCCGVSIIGRPHSLGHRKRRSQSGSNELSNLLTFLGLGLNPLDPDDHHARIDSRLNPADEDRGYTVRSFKDPAAVPVAYVSADGREVRYWLTDDGQLLEEPPEGVAA